MNILSIEINNDCKSTLNFPKLNLKLYCVKLTIKKYFWKTEIIEAYPTKICKNSGDNEFPLFFYYCDKFGKTLSDDDSLQINNFIINQILIKDK